MQNPNEVPSASGSSEEEPTDDQSPSRVELTDFHEEIITPSDVAERELSMLDQGIEEEATSRLLSRRELDEMTDDFSGDIGAMAALYEPRNNARVLEDERLLPENLIRYNPFISEDFQYEIDGNTYNYQMSGQEKYVLYMVLWTYGINGTRWSEFSNWPSGERAQRDFKLRFLSSLFEYDGEGFLRISGRRLLMQFSDDRNAGESMWDIVGFDYTPSEGQWAYSGDDLYEDISDWDQETPGNFFEFYDGEEGQAGHNGELRRHLRAGDVDMQNDSNDREQRTLADRIDQWRRTENLNTINSATNETNRNAQISILNTLPNREHFEANNNIYQQNYLRMQTTKYLVDQLLENNNAKSTRGQLVGYNNRIAFYLRLLNIDEPNSTIWIREEDDNVRIILRNPETDSESMRVLNLQRVVLDDGQITYGNIDNLAESSNMDFRSIPISVEENSESLPYLVALGRIEESSEIRETVERYRNIAHRESLDEEGLFQRFATGNLTFNPDEPFRYNRNRSEESEREIARQIAEIIRARHEETTGEDDERFFDTYDANSQEERNLFERTAEILASRLIRQLESNNGTVIIVDSFEFNKDSRELRPEINEEETETASENETTSEASSSVQENINAELERYRRMPVIGFLMGFLDMNEISEHILVSNNGEVSTKTIIVGILASLFGFNKTLGSLDADERNRLMDRINQRNQDPRDEPRLLSDDSTNSSEQLRLTNEGFRSRFGEDGPIPTNIESIPSSTIALEENLELNPNERLYLGPGTVILFARRTNIELTDENNNSLNQTDFEINENGRMVIPHSGAYINPTTSSGEQQIINSNSAFDGRIRLMTNQYIETPSS